MFKHMLIATDGSDLSEHAALRAVQLAKKIDAHITAISVSLPFHAFTADYVMIGDKEDAYNHERAHRAARNLAVVGKAAEAAGVPFQGVHVFREQPYAAIIEAAEQRGCDLICMASHGRKGLTALIVGSETMKVLTHSSIPVLVFR